MSGCGKGWTRGGGRALVAALVAMVCGLSGAPGGSGALAATDQVATLTPTVAGPSLLAAGGNVVVAVDQPASVGLVSPGVVDVFAAGDHGHWTSGGPVATLTDPGGSDPSADASSLVTDGDVVVLGVVGADGYTDSLLVYVRPVGGWSGAVAPAARLAASTGASFTGVSVSGSTIAAGGSDGTSYVFAEPSGGWTGTLAESARLADPGVPLQPDPLVHGRAVYVSRENPAGDYAVFAEPSQGWAGTILPSGSLLTSGGPDPRFDQLAFSGTLAAATSRTGLGVEVFGIPRASAGGRPVALAFLQQAEPQAANELLFSSDVAVDAYNSRGDATSPLFSTISAATRPSGGWHGVQFFARPFVQRSVRCCTYPVAGVALVGRTVFVQTASGQIEVIEVSGREGRLVPSPRARHAIIRGLRDGHPSISLDVVDSVNPTSVGLTLPPGLAISHNRRTLRRSVSFQRDTAIRISIHRRTVELRGVYQGELAGGPLVIRRGALRESRSLRAAVASDPRSVRLSVTLTVHDDSGGIQRTHVRLRSEPPVSHVR